MNVILSFATETAGSAVIADMFRDLADFLYANKLRGNFHLTGDFARTLRKNNRRDVIKALVRHEIGYHCNHHGARPFMGGYCESEPWQQAVATWLAEETPGLKIVEELFERRPVYYTTEFVKAPQVVYGAWLAGMHSIGFMRGGPPDNAPLPNAGQGAAWFCNMFVPSSHDLMGIDSSPNGPDTESRRLADFRRVADHLRENVGVMRAYMHMYRMIRNTTKPRHSESVYRTGTHYEEHARDINKLWLPASERAARMDRIERIINHMKNEPDCHFVGYEEYRSLYHPGAGQWLTLPEMDALAEQLIHALDAVVLDTVSISPAESFGLFVRVLRIYQETNNWPDRIAMRSLLGPVDEREAFSAPEALSFKSVSVGLTAIDRALDDDGYLPHVIDFDGITFPPGKVLLGIVDIYRCLRARRTVPDLVPCVAPDLPAIATDPFFQEDEFQHFSGGISLYPDGFTGARICRLSKLQSWSWKPAVRRQT